MLTDIMILAYTTVFPPTGFNPVNDKYHQDEISDQEIITKFGSFRVMFTSFLGLPNQDTAEGKPLLPTICKNLAGWQDHRSFRQNILLACLWLPANLFQAVFKFTINLAKLITEFLPQLVIRLSSLAIDHHQHHKNGSKLDWQHALGMLGLVLSSSIYFIGKAVTSPINNILNAWTFSESFAKTDQGKKFWGISLIFLSAAITTTVYAFLFLLIAAAITATGGSMVLGNLAAGMEPLSSFMGSSLILPESFAITPAITGFAITMGTLFGASFSTLGTLISQFVLEPLTHYFDKPPALQPAEIKSDYESLQLRREESSSTWKIMNTRLNTLIHDPVQKIRNLFPAAEAASEHEKPLPSPSDKVGSASPEPEIAMTDSTAPKHSASPSEDESSSEDRYTNHPINVTVEDEPEGNVFFQLVR